MTRAASNDRRYGPHRSASSAYKPPVQNLAACLLKGCYYVGIMNVPRRALIFAFIGVGAIALAASLFYVVQSSQLNAG
jgi:hypothetical protein